MKNSRSPCCGMMILVILFSAGPFGWAAVTAKEGRVRAVNEERGFVIVDLGRADNVKKNTVFVVEKEGRALATLTVLEIRDVMTACQIREVKPNSRIAVGDPVRIRKERL